MLKAVLFDLDGTLLPMASLDAFIKEYFGGITKHLAQYGYVPDKLMKCIWGATMSVMKNDGKLTNEELFWQEFSKITATPDVRLDEPKFNEFYEKHFDEYRTACGYNPDAAVAVKKIREMGLSTVLATNPVFPRIATEKRAAWAGLAPTDFELITTYENSHFCKPSTEYYNEVLEKIGLLPEECIMVGNDIDDDMVAADLGMKVFLLPACLINKRGVDISIYPHGDFADLLKFIKINLN